MKALRIVLIVSSLVLTGLPQSTWAADSEKRDQIVRLMKAMNTNDLVVQLSKVVLPQFSDLIKKANPKITDEFVNAVYEEIHTLLREQEHKFTDLMVEIYSRHFPTQELKEINAFYETPTGQKTIRVMPRLFQEGQVAGQKWMQSVMPLLERRVWEKLESGGYRWG